MPGELPSNDPRNVWQNQATEPFRASLDELRRKAKRWQTRARLKTFCSIILGLALSSAFARIAITGRDVIPRLGATLLSLWSIYFAYQARRWLWPDRLSRTPAPALRFSSIEESSKGAATIISVSGAARASRFASWGWL